MTTFEMIMKSIEFKKSRGSLTDKYIESTKNKLDVFLLNDRITEEEFNTLNDMLK